MANGYSDKLKDPRWQKKRLKIFERDNWTCQICGSTENSLVAHHLWYFTNTEPWDYDDSYLTTLCEACHIIETDETENATNWIKYSLSRSFFSRGIRSIGFLISANTTFELYNPQHKGKHKGQVNINGNWISHDEGIHNFFKHREITEQEQQVLFNTTVPKLLNLLYTPKTEVSND